MKREPFFDNAKFILIVLVVFGHVIQPMIEDVRGVSALYQLIYVFHMPAMIVLSGYFQRGIHTVREGVQLAKKLLIPYLVFQVIYNGYYAIANVAPVKSIADPHWSLWFMISLFSWNVLLTFFKRLKPKTGLLLAVGLGLIVGFIEGIDHSYSLSRTFVFFPFFLLGYHLDKDRLLSTFRFRKVGVMLSVLLAAWTVLYVFGNFSSGWLFQSSSYQALGVPSFGVWYRLTYYLLATLFSFIIFSLIPKRRKRFTDLGQKSLYVYLLHGFFIQYFRQSGMIQIYNLLDVGVAAGISLLIVFVLSSRPIWVSFQPLIELNVQALRKSLKRLET